MAKQYKTKRNSSRIKKPWFAASADLFSAVWKWLYILIVPSFGFVAIMATLGHISFWVFLPFLLNLGANFAFLFSQSRPRNTMTSALLITAVVITLLWAMAAVYPAYQWITYLQLPYLVWSLYATLFQFSIVSRND